MAETKYGKYFLSELKPEERQQGFGRFPFTVVWTDDDVIKGSHLFWALLHSPSFVPPSHGPHTHKDPEVLVILGTNPDDPSDLGAEIDLYMGPEMEKHTITKSTLVYIPANFLHCPIVYRNVKRPYIFIQCQYAPKLTEKSFKKLVPEEERNKMVSFDVDGTQSMEDMMKQIPKEAVEEMTKQMPEDMQGLFQDLMK